MKEAESKRVLHAPTTMILLSGGEGKRMGSHLPKQYLPLQGKPVVAHSLSCFLDHPSFTQYIVVCAPDYHPFFPDPRIEFALPGVRRQDSLYHGLSLVRTDWVCVHDAARPFLTHELLSRLLDVGQRVGAATLATPVVSTIKEGTPDQQVQRTLERERLWEIQTPQLIATALLAKGFAYAERHQLTVTDDVALAELVDHPVALVVGSRENIKITTPIDLLICQNMHLPSPTTAPTT